MSILDSIFGNTRKAIDANTTFAPLRISATPEATMAGCQQAPDAESTPDDTPAYLAMAGEEVTCAIHHLELACADSRVDASVRRKALGALRDALTAIEAEMEARNGDAR